MTAEVAGAGDSIAHVPAWEGPDGPLAQLVTQHSEQSLAVYRADPRRVDEDAGQEEDLATGGYGRRQLFELVQNGADALIDYPGGRIRVELTEHALYCANEGKALEPSGVSALMHAHISPKRGSEIGRFGLGFKSVLGVTRHPRFYSRSASFAFSGKESKRRIQEVVADREQYPVLRLAQPLKPEVDAAADPVLSSLMEWATTIVKLPLAGQGEWLLRDIAEFPPEFLLFSPHVGSLELADSFGTKRVIKLERTQDVLTLNDGKDASSWKVFSRQVVPSDKAKSDAGKLAARDALPLQWAVPIDGRVRTGHFWAFFPLRDETTLSGIANAPWQVNDDRTGMLETSLLNRELIDGLADLVVEHVAELHKPSDPGWIMDVFPARGRESRGWGDDIISRIVFERLKTVACVPDVSGRLRPILKIRVPPQPGREPERAALEFWGEAPHLESDWCHPSAISTSTRRARVDRLLEGARLKERPLTEWLESVVPSPADPSDSVHALQLLNLLTASDAALATHSTAARRAAIVLLQRGSISALSAGTVFLPADEPFSAKGLDIVHEGVASDEGAREMLAKLGVQPISAELELRRWLKTLRLGRQDVNWAPIWSIVRKIDDASDAAQILQTDLDPLKPVRVKVASGEWRGIHAVLLPGSVASADRDPNVTVDMAFHADDTEVLRALGLSTGPGPGYPASREPFVGVYLQRCYQKYTKEDLGTRTTPSEQHMTFVEKDLCGPLAPLEALGVDARAAFTSILLETAGALEPWTLCHSTQDKYPKMKVPNPAVALLEAEGMLATGTGITPLSRCVGRQFQRWSSFLPFILIDPRYEEALHIPSSMKDLAKRSIEDPAFWAQLCDGIEGAVDDVGVADFYAAACAAQLAPPPALWCRVGNEGRSVDRREVAVCDGTRTYEAMKKLGKPAIVVPALDHREALVQRWNLRLADEDVQTRPVWAAASASIPIDDFFPLLREELDQKGLRGFELVPCSDLGFEISTHAGTKTEDSDFVVLDAERKVLWRSELGPEVLLRELDRAYGLDLTAEDVDDVLHQRLQAEEQDRLRVIRSLGTHPERLVELVGGAALKSRLSVDLLAAVETIHGAADDLRLADLVLAVHRYDTLKFLRADLEAAGFTPPTSWAGSPDAREYVRRLGFEKEYAGFRGSSRERQVFVPGPSALPDEHGYQREIMDRIGALLDGSEEHPRGMLSLPTGAGKTRVAAQALVEALRDGRLASPILWVAQSDELCEQAVQSWSDVWQRYGSRSALTISRLWASNDVEAALDGPQVVVATSDKLRARVEDPAYEWLSTASCVVVDEAHTATAATYTKILEWQGILHRGATRRTRCPLIGLTATPFRGRSESETKRLVERFGRIRLDPDREDFYGELQAQGVLASIDGEDLTGTSIVLTDEEAQSFEKLKDMPKGVYRRIASDIDRNQRLISSIRSKPQDWPILLFALSTEHAHTLAALLRLEGVEAVAVDHETDTDLRRRYVDEFRSGEIQVICNYSVLTQGFDAPAVRAIYVTRPTFSPNVYQQMIGRGLRGPLNGGKERCLIVNVADNWARFGEQLAFREFEHLWTRT